MIPLARPWIGAEEQEAVQRVLSSGRLVKGPECEAFERALAEVTGRGHAVALCSGTAALYVALRATGIEAGARVAVPALTYPATANAVQLCGAQVVLCDVRDDTWNLDPARLREAGPLAGVVPVDQFGLPADWNAIGDLAAEHDAVVVEDAACALGASRDGIHPGGRAGAAIVSFHPRKIITTGEGVAVLTDDAAVAARCRRLRDHGIGPDGAFLEPALNLRLSELAAGVGRVQLRRLQDAVARRIKLAAQYRDRLDDGARFGLQQVDDGVVHTYQTFAVLLPDSGPDRDQVVRSLRAAGVEASIASYGLHRIPHLWGRADRRRADADFPVASLLADRGLALPLYPELSESDVDVVAVALHEIMERR